MKTIAFINGSPKSDHDSCSKKMINYFKQNLDETNHLFIEGNALKLCSPQNNEALEVHYKEVLTADTLVFVSPLYVDNLPSSLLDYLERFERFVKTYPTTIPPSLKVYAFINCGFLGGYQNYIALEILQHFANRMHFNWCGGLGIGSGAMLGSTLDSVPREATMQRPIYEGLDAFIAALKAGRSIDTPTKQLLVTQQFSPALFTLMLNMSWIAQSGYKFRSIYAKPYLK